MLELKLKIQGGLDDANFYDVVNALKAINMLHGLMAVAMTKWGENQPDKKEYFQNAMKELGGEQVIPAAIAAEAIETTGNPERLFIIFQATIEGLRSVAKADGENLNKIIQEVLDTEGGKE